MRAVALALALAACGSDRPARPAAPTFQLADLAGAPIDLAALRGRVVLLDFWATWCGPCRDEAPALVELDRRYRPRGVTLVGLSMDDEPAPVIAFVRTHGIAYPVAVADAALGQRYGGVLGLPEKFLIDRDGRVAYRHTGPVDGATLARELDALLAE